MIQRPLQGLKGKGGWERERERNELELVLERFVYFLQEAVQNEKQPQHMIMLD